MVYVQYRYSIGMVYVQYEYSIGMVYIQYRYSIVNVSKQELSFYMKILFF